MSQHGQRRINGVVYANQAHHEKRYYDNRANHLKPRVISGRGGGRSGDKGLPPRDPREARLVAQHQLHKKIAEQARRQHGYSNGKM